MSQVCITLSLVLFSIRLINGYPGETVMFPYETRAMDPYSSQASQQYASQFQATRNANRPQQVLHTDVTRKRPPQVPMMEKPNNQNLTIGEFMAAMNDLPYHREEELQLSRAAGSAGRDDIPSYSSRPIGYSNTNYGAAATYHETPSALTPTPSPVQPKIPVLKPDFSSFMKPMTTKVSGKFDGLLGLILSLFSSSAEGTPMSGLKGLLIDGIIKPLLVAKKGIKSLISRLMIPVIALLLINLEVLITVWWVWEDCPASSPAPIPPPPTPEYSKPAYNYNSYS